MAKAQARGAEGRAVAVRDASLQPAVGPYTIVERVASRAFTVTYRAEQPAVGRTVLVRTLKPAVSPSSPFAAELEREARILGKLDHPGLPRLFDFVRGADAIFLVIEDTHATPLDRVIVRRRRLDPEIAVAVTLAAARALAHAHAAGVVHRAVSPIALGITPSGRVIVGDFGAAKAVLGDLPVAPGVAEPDDLSEASSFVAPEQILGDAVGPQADVWALGVVCHQMVAGTNPFAEVREGRAEAADEAPREIAKRIRTSPPAPLPADTAPALARVISRCLAKEPTDRYADARALADAIEAGFPALSRAALEPIVARAIGSATGGSAIGGSAIGGSAIGGSAIGGSAIGSPVARPTGRSGATERASTSSANDAEDAAPARGPFIDVRRVATSLAAVLLLMVAGFIALRALDDRDAGEGEGVTESPAPGTAGRGVGLVRVVARPWAEVYVDGELADTTPIGRPLRVSPGRHFITFRHPSAPDEQRSIKVAGGQSVFLDVTMRIDRGDAGALRDAGEPAASP